MNCIVPVAASRMTEGLLPPAMFELLDPKHIVPMVRESLCPNLV